jgi:hypothetical protein
VTQIEQAGQVLPTVDPPPGALIHTELTNHGVEVLTDTTVTAITSATATDARPLRVSARTVDGRDIAGQPMWFWSWWACVPAASSRPTPASPSSPGARSPARTTGGATTVAGPRGQALSP